VRVLVSTTAGTGHFGPLVPFARSCASAGHEVAVAAPTSFRAEVSAAGFEHLPFADAPAELRDPVFARVPTLSFERANEVVVTEVFGRLDAQAAWPGLVEVLDGWRPDLVLREPCELGSLVAACSAGVPQAVVAIGVSATTDYMRPLVSAPLAELDELAGLAEGTADTVMRTAATFTCVPGILDGAGTTAPADAGPVHRFHDAPPSPGSGGLPAVWGDPALPLLYVTLGSVAARLPGLGDLYAAILQAFADQPVRVLLTTGHGLDPSELGAVPPNARVEKWWPQADVMPHAAAMVGHGGFGTTMAALAAGVPQVVLPLFAFDQRVNADHVAAAGAGLAVDGGPAAVGALPDAVARLLAERSYRDCARAVAEEMAALPPVDDAVPILERVASR
jgi:hypothetical protein